MRREIARATLGQAGAFTSPALTAPDKPGNLYVVETVTNQAGQVVHRGSCGAVSESTVVPKPTQPAITTNAPKDATTGEMIRGTARLTGPFDQGTVIQFWVQHADYLNPAASGDDLACATPDPNDMTGATLAAETTLDHSIAEGVTETVTSPQFTSNQAGCTFIKEIALSPGAEDEKPQVIVQGWFGQANETTRWHTSTGPSADTGGSLARTGATIWPLAALGVTLVAVGTVAVVAVRRRR